MVDYGGLWCTMVYYGDLWWTMVYYGVLWCTMVYYGVLWCNKSSISNFVKKLSFDRMVKRLLFRTDFNKLNLTFFLLLFNLN